MITLSISHILRVPLPRYLGIKYINICKPSVFNSDLRLNLCTHTNLSLPQDVGFKELKSKLHSKEMQLIDVRSQKEIQEDGFVPGSINMPLPSLGTMLLLDPEEFKDEFGFEKPTGTVPIAVMCVLGIRARTAQLALMGAGYSNVRLYAGSLKDWKENEGEIEFNVPENDGV